MSKQSVKTLFSLEGRVALVSGASRGIGQAIAAGLAGAGATVIGCGRSPRSASTPDGAVVYRQCDVTNANEFSTLCDGIRQQHGKLNIYVHAAGITLSDSNPAERASNFDRTLEVNLGAAYRCCLAVAELMSPADGGSIINITSIGSVLGFPGNPGYVAAKGGLRMMSKALALDFGARNIRVNNIAPGYIRTDMTEQSYQDPVRNHQRLERTILGRWGEPRDLVGAAIFLASDASAYVTGLDLFVDGGWTAKGL